MEANMDEDYFSDGSSDDEYNLGGISDDHLEISAVLGERNNRKHYVVVTEEEIIQRLSEHPDAWAEELSVDARLKPCTASGCGCAIRVVDESSPDADVRCLCGNEFCWRCGGAPHWPSTCAAVARLTREADMASADWILLHTKPCPKCRRPAEKEDEHDECYDSVVCAAPCKHRFCWRCLRPRKTRDRGHNKDCVERYALEDEEEERVKRHREQAKLALDRFLHDHDLWMAKQLALRHDAEHELRRLRDDAISSVVENAWAVVVEGRRVLGNAFAFGRSLLVATTKEEDDDDPHRRMRRQLFEHHRGEMDAALDRLQQCIVADATGSMAACNKDHQRCKLLMPTSATQRFVHDFAKAVEEAGAASS
ncbi:hypothetical protein PR202_gb02402 [Eleusine coracana subsp. coracana]|uniref:RBR-type E3 ubiquitin transferase n=1 Tax=Eleusine coracana subsp. coracana TaxID=191504 RepID=A0AAV5DYF8_ELECO|nr:hypothetical protein QOZ80_8BG0668930 [Eleusine coracana subsp. coracana]GJN15482.1 hypothetical protein PR202_gb02402 [Eleusine coracana subsp. coracana]